ncbi:hypothetical protein GLOIN_2v1761866 [Rhizophagus irregularis DAOM 181602=DAOM 197198]|nr:hypothetical protein GLOIN_2v1761866 [Rhizophagus irregularis DAOM 181602=DAOM 197198]
MNELKVLSQHLLDYNRRTFEKFMLDIEKEYRERINANKKLRCEIDNLKMQVEETEKELASMKSHLRQRKTCDEHKAELEEENFHLRSELQIEVDTNRQNER